MSARGVCSYCGAGKAGKAMQTIEELEAALAAALAAREQTNEQRIRAQAAAWKTLAADPTSWEWRATPQKPWSRDDPPNQLRVECRVKQDLLEAWRAGGTAGLSYDSQTPERWIGMNYWRTDEGILTHSGGGHLVLNDPVLCSDAQWADLQQGIVPLKWQRNTRFG